MSSMEVQGPPYPSTNAGVGGVPTVTVDIPILAIFILFYVGAAIGHMSLLQINRRKNHKFLFSGALFGFCMARILTCALRMGWATHQHNVSLAIAAQIFLNAGILIIYIVNLILAQRVLRARQPPVGWHKALRIVFKILYGLIALALVLIITFIVLQFYTLNEHLKQVCRDVQLAIITFFLIFATLPALFLALAFALPKHPDEETFGKDSLRSKAVVLLVSTGLCLLNAGFKAGTTWEEPRPLDNPAWYQGKAAFYCFYFMLEIFLIYWLLLARVDQRFHVPDGSSKVQTYRSAERQVEEQAQDAQRTPSHGSSEAEKEPEV